MNKKGRNRRKKPHQDGQGVECFKIPNKVEKRIASAFHFGKEVDPEAGEVFQAPPRFVFNAQVAGPHADTVLGGSVRVTANR